MKSWFLSNKCKARDKLRKLSFVQTFANFSRSTQFVLIAMIAAGLIVLFFCGRLDLSDSTWWHSKSYLPNIWASLTSFLIGPPFGPIILDTFTGERQDKAVLSRVNNLSKLAWDEYREVIYRFCAPDRIAILKDDVHSVQRIHDEVVKALSDYEFAMGNRDSADRQTVTPR
jgi:hypothetical protein